MDQMQEVSARQGKGSTFNETSSLNGLGTQDFRMEDPNYSDEVRKLVLNQYRYRGVSGSRPSATVDTAMRNELKLRKLVTVEPNSGTKATKPTSGYFDMDSYPENVSEELKDRFTTLNLKHGAVIPENFKIYVDCKQFQSSDVEVSIKDDFIVVHAYHQNTFDDHGMVCREFIRRWRIPEDVKQDKFSCLLDRHNILTIQAPRQPTSIVVPVQIEKLQDWKTSEV